MSTNNYKYSLQVLSLLAPPAARAPENLCGSLLEAHAEVPRWQQCPQESIMKGRCLTIPISTKQV